MSKANQAIVNLERFIVGDVSIVVKEWMGQRVISCRDIDRIHEREKGTTLRNFKSNVKKFNLNLDYYKLSSYEIRRLENGNELGYNYPHGSYVFTKSGYLMLVKSLNDDKAWEIQRQLVNAYFVLEKMIADKANKDVKAPAVVETKNLPATPNNPNEKNPAVSELIDLFKQSIAYQNAQLEVERKKNEDFRAVIGESFKLMNTVIELLTTQLHPENEKIQAKDDTVSKFQAISDYSEWQREINEMVTKIYNDSVPGTFKDRNAVLNTTYKLLQSEYGTCWEQSRKEYREMNGRNPRNSMELEYFIEKSNPNCENLMIAKLNTLYKETSAVKSEM